MVVFKWLQSVIAGSPEATQAAAGQRAEELKKKGKGRAVDLVNAAFVDHAEDLEDLIRSGSSLANRKKIKRQVKQKIEEVIADEFDNPELIDEITERITDVAEIDPYYKKMFCNKSQDS